MMSPEELLQKVSLDSKEIEYNGIKITIKSLSFPEIAHLTPHIDRGNTEYVAKYLAKRTLMKSFPEWSEEQTDKFIESCDSKFIVTVVRAVKSLSVPDSTDEEGKKP